MFDGGWREAFVVDTGDGRFGEVLSAPLDPLPTVLPATPVLGSRAPLHDAAVAWVADARARLRSGALLAIDYCRPTTGSMATRPWRDWLRTYRGHERGDHYLVSPGSQDITVEVALDQFPDPDAVSSQVEFLQRWGIDDLVAEGERRWVAKRGRPRSWCVGDAQPGDRGQGAARSHRAGRLRRRRVVGYRLPTMNPVPHGRRSARWVAPVVAAASLVLVGSTLAASSSGLVGAGATTTAAATTTASPTTTVAAATTTPPSLPPPADEASDPVRALVPSIVAVDDELTTAAERQPVVVAALTEATNAVAVPTTPGTLCAVVPVSAPLMAAGRWERNGDTVAESALTRRDPPGYGDCITADGRR